MQISVWLFIIVIYYVILEQNVMIGHWGFNGVSMAVLGYNLSVFRLF